jgi:hypothetical protein
LITIAIVCLDGLVRVLENLCCSCKSFFACEEKGDVIERTAGRIKEHKNVLHIYELIHVGYLGLNRFLHAVVRLFDSFVAVHLLTVSAVYHI